jgi:nucleotide-binding universal stress UspA family protein
MSTPPVIAAVDGSDNSLRALDWAVESARRRGAPLRVVHARQYAAWAQPDVLVAGPPDPDDDAVLDQVRTLLADRAGPPPVQYVVTEGAPGAVLPELGLDAALLVLGSRGRGGFTGLLLGSNGMAVARDADCPVVVVPPADRATIGDGPAEPGPRVVVGVNVDSPDEATLAFAVAEAARQEARLDVVAAYAWPVQTWAAPGEFVPPAIDQGAIEDETRRLAEGFLAPHRTAHPEVRADVRATPGDVAGNLVAASKGACLVVVGRHRRRLLAPARMIGSVTQAVLLHAPCPIAVVPPPPPES